MQSVLTMLKCEISVLSYICSKDLRFFRYGLFKNWFLLKFTGVLCSPFYSRTFDIKFSRHEIRKYTQIKKLKTYKHTITSSC